MSLNQDLLITSQQLKELTQLNTDDLAGTTVVRERNQRKSFIAKRLALISREQRPSLIIFCTLIFMLLFAWFTTKLASTTASLSEWILFYFDNTIKSTIVATVLFCLFDLILLIFHKQRIKHLLSDSKLETLRDLLSEVERYNQVAGNLIINLSAIDQLNDAGAPVSVNNRQQVLTAIKSMKNDLLRALKIERIFRQNPKINPDSLELDFTPILAIELSNRAVHYSNEVNELVSIGISVQNEINSLLKHERHHNERYQKTSSDLPFDF